MTKSFGDTVRRLRIESGLSQQQLADRLHVGRPSVANWEVGRRMPDVATVALIAETLGVDTAALLAAAEESDGAPNVLLVDDSPIVLEGGLPILRQALPGANIVGFTRRQEAVEYFRRTRYRWRSWTLSWAGAAVLTCAGNCCASARAPT